MSSDSPEESNVQSEDDTMPQNKANVNPLEEYSPVFPEAKAIEATESNDKPSGVLQWFGRKLLADDTYEAFEVMAELLDKLEKDLYKTTQQEPMGLLHLTSGLTFVSKFRHENIFSSEQYVTDPVQIGAFYHWWRYAVAVFGWMLLNKWIFQNYDSGPNIGGGIAKGEEANVKAVLSHVGIKRDDLIAFKFSSELYDPGHFFALDHAESAMVISIRGSFSVRDAITDVVAKAVPLQDGFAHDGMLRAARNKLKILEPLIRATHETYPTYKLVIVGHSLGGSVAGVLALLCEEHFKVAKTKKNNDEAMTENDNDTWAKLPTLKIHAYCYACPPCVSLELALKAARTTRANPEPLITSFALDNDIVPRLSYYSLKGLLVITRLYTSMKSSNSHGKRLFQMMAKSNFLGSSLTTSLSSFMETSHLPSMEEIEEALKFHRAEFTHDRLYIPGRLLYLRSSRPRTTMDENDVHPHHMGVKVRMEESNATFFHEITLQDRFFSDHLPASYNAALLRVKNDVVFHCLDNVVVKSSRREWDGVSLQVKLVDRFLKVWRRDTNLNGKPVAFWRPVLSPSDVKDGWQIVGDVVTTETKACERQFPTGDVFGMAVRVKESANMNPLCPPTSYRLLWNDKANQSIFTGILGPERPCYVWRPIPPDDYVALGLIVTNTPEPPRDVPLGCIHRSFLTTLDMAAMRQNLELGPVWSDEGYELQSDEERYSCPPLSAWLPYRSLPREHADLHQKVSQKARRNSEQKQRLDDQMLSADMVSPQVIVVDSEQPKTTIFGGHTFVASRTLDKPPPVIFAFTMQ